MTHGPIAATADLSGGGLGGEAGGAGPVRPPGGLEFIQVAFAGHNRSSDLGDRDALSTHLDRAFQLLTEAGVTEAKLLTGLAEGADVIAARAWREAGHGPIHVVFPFLEDRPPPEERALAELASWLDGASTARKGRNPHLAQTRWILGSADLLVAVWSGEHGRGAGGTADAVRLALEHGIPVVWVQPGSPRLRLIQPQHLAEDFGFQEFIEMLEEERAPLVAELTAPALRRALEDVGVEAADRPTPAREPLRRHRRAHIYGWFRRTLGGPIAPLDNAEAPADLAAQPGFARLTSALKAAGAEAEQLGALHRSHQVILLGLAVAAAITGSLPGMWPDLKPWCVAGELALALAALLIWLDSERTHTHQRWAVARRITEDLRIERVSWTIGMPSSRHGILAVSAEDAARERRRAGLPVGVFDEDRVRRWGRWAVDELMGGQAAYHRRHGLTNGRISHRVHLFENLSFTILLTVLVGYLATAAWDAIVGGAGPPHWVGGLVFMAGAIVPAIGAAGLALEATLSLREEAQRSSELAVRLETLATSLGDAPGLPALQNVAGAAIRLQRAQEDRWLEGAVRRRLVRGG